VSKQTTEEVQGANPGLVLLENQTTSSVQKSKKMVLHQQRGDHPPPGCILLFAVFLSLFKVCPKFKTHLVNVLAISFFLSFHTPPNHD
jgi:hypothetical protein